MYPRRSVPPDEIVQDTTTVDTFLVSLISMCRQRPSNGDMLPECAREYLVEEREPEEPEISPSIPKNV